MRVSTLLLTIMVTILPFLAATRADNGHHLVGGAARREAKRNHGRVYSPPRSSSSSGLTDEEQSELLKAHNDARSKADADDVTWSDDLAQAAMVNAGKCRYGHASNLGKLGQGENIAAGSGPKYDVMTGFNDWVTESKYGAALCSENFSDKCGHYSQIVWKKTTEIGCAKKRCSASQLGLGGTYEDSIYLVCRYGPAGNVLGEFPQNVELPNDSSSSSTDSSDSHSTTRKGYGSRGNEQSYGSSGSNSRKGIQSVDPSASNAGHVKSLQGSNPLQSLAALPNRLKSFSGGNPGNIESLLHDMGDNDGGSHHDKGFWRSWSWHTKKEAGLSSDT